MKISHPLKTIVAVIVASSLTLTACSRGTGEEPAGSEDTAERIASLGLGDVDTLLALGITPVAVAPWGAEGDVDESGVGPWSKELLGDARPETIYNTGAGFSAEVLEEVMAASPTQIIAVNQAVDEKAKADLEAIAPTTTHSGEYEDWQVPWDEQVEEIAAAVGKEAEGDELIDDTEEAFQEFREVHPEHDGVPAAIVMPYDGKIGVYTSGDGRGQFIEQLGFEIPAGLEGDGSSFFIDLAPENYAELNQVDRLFVLDYHGAADVLKTDETFTNLDIAKQGKVTYLDTDTGTAMSMPNPVTIPWAIEKFAAAL